MAYKSFVDGDIGGCGALVSNGEEVGLVMGALD